jgi:hypothetical protein
MADGIEPMPASALPTEAFPAEGAAGAGPLPTEPGEPFANGTVLSMEVPNAARPVPAVDARVSVPVLLPCMRVALDGDELGVWDVVMTADCPVPEESAGRLVSFLAAGRAAAAGAPAVPAFVTPASAAAFSGVWRWIRL